MKDNDIGKEQEVIDTVPQRMKGRSLLSELIESQNKAKLEQDHTTSDESQTLNQDLTDTTPPNQISAQIDQNDAKVRAKLVVIPSSCLCTFFF